MSLLYYLKPLPKTLDETPRGIEWDFATIGNYKSQRRSFKNLWIAAGCICDMPSCLINIEHIGDIDLEPSSKSLNLLKRWYDTIYFSQLTRWYIKITESTINTVILIFLIHRNQKFAGLFHQMHLSSSSLKCPIAKVSLYTVSGISFRKLTNL